MTGTSYPSSLVTSPTNTSPRESSDGYDVVSEAQGSPQTAARSTAAAGATPTPTPAKPATMAKSADEEEDDEEDDEEEESGGSDWE